MITKNLDSDSHKINKLLLKKQLELTTKVKNILSNPEIYKTIDKYNNKVYSKRFITALQKIDNHFRIEKYFSNASLCLCFYGNERAINIKEENRGYVSAYYVDGTFYLLNFQLDSISAELINNRLREYYIDILKCIEKLESTIKNYDILIEQYNLIADMYNNFYNTLDPYFCKLNNIKYN